MVASALPFLMFQGKANEAIELYTSVIPNTKVLEIKRYGAGEPGAEGTVALATLSIAGQKVICNDSPVKHAFDFTPSISFFIECESEEELARLAERLSNGGNVYMPPDNYGFSRRFAWVGDPFGVSWQLNLR